MKNVVLYILIFLTVNGYSEIKEFKIQVVKSSISVGQILDVSVLVIHDEAEKLYFPKVDSIAGRFEIVSKKVFPTKRTEVGFLLDSAVYGVRTFEIVDSLPFFIDVKEGNSKNNRSNIVWINVAGGVKEAKKSQVVPNASYIMIDYQSNKNLYTTLLVFGALLSLLFLVFGLPLVLHLIKKKRFIKKHELFHVHKFDESWDSTQWEYFLAKWREDLSRSKNKNLSGYTFTQLLEEVDSKKLEPVILKLQSFLYNPGDQSKLDRVDFDKLKAYAHDNFETKLDQWDR